MTQAGSKSSGAALGWIVAAVISFVAIGQCSSKQSASGPTPAVAAATTTGTPLYVSARSLNCRSSPDATAKPLRTLTRNASVSITQEDSGWSKVDGIRPAGFPRRSCRHLHGPPAKRRARADQVRLRPGWALRPILRLSLHARSLRNRPNPSAKRRDPVLPAKVAITAAGLVLAVAAMFALAHAEAAIASRAVAISVMEFKLGRRRAERECDTGPRALGIRLQDHDDARR